MRGRAGRVLRRLATGIGLMLSAASPSAAAEPQADLVMLGDSISAWGDWPALLPGRTIVNLGIPGDTSTGVRGRLDTVKAARPRRVLLMIGVNDLSWRTQPYQIAANVRAIVRELKQDGLPTTMQSTLFVSARLDAEHKLNGRIGYLNQLLGIVAAEEGAPLIDVNATLAPGGSLDTRFTEDGIHLNRAGYEAWAARLRVEFK